MCGRMTGYGDDSNCLGMCKIEGKQCMARKIGCTGCTMKNMSKSITLKLIWEGGNSKHVLSSDATFFELLDICSSKTQLSSPIEILFGYPPKVLEANLSDQISALGVESGTSLSIRKSRTPVIRRNQQIKRKIIDADNSCLFTAIRCLVYGFDSDPECTMIFRSIVSERIRSDSNYSEAMLGKPKEEYADWILRPESWGGEIEMSILAEYLETIIHAMDIQTGNLYRFGSSQYSKGIYLLYDGIHYDAIVSEIQTATTTSFPVEESHTVTSTQSLFATQSTPTSPTTPSTLSPSSSSSPSPSSSSYQQTQELELQLRHLAQELKRQSSFTDVHSFSLRCLVCRVGLKGQQEAISHARETGHQNFGQY